MSQHLKTYNEVAAELGVYRWTISDLVRVWGLTPKPIRANSKAKGLDQKDVRVIRRALNMVPARAA